MTRFGYARVSSSGQSLDIQIERLNGVACEYIRSEKVSGSTMTNRPELRTLLDFMRAGDQLWVTKIDRLARDLGDLCVIVKELDAKGCSLHATDEPIETASLAGKMLVQILGVVAQFENGRRRERQLAGIDAARRDGRYKGRSRSFDPAAVVAAHKKNPNLGATRLARKLGCSKHTVYRCLKEAGITSLSQQ